mmetsp:Transcript_37816/g.92038  ORF Transcript_37816/g.92038 Transcript_37816/m.92038 type:complete len:165 (-) Transcript_37816:555-1049(-)
MFPFTTFWERKESCSKNRNLTSTLTTAILFKKQNETFSNNRRKKQQRRRQQPNQTQQPPLPLNLKTDTNTKLSFVRSFVLHCPYRHCYFHHRLHQVVLFYLDCRRVRHHHHHYHHRQATTIQSTQANKPTNNQTKNLTTTSLRNSDPSYIGHRSTPTPKSFFQR